MVPRAPPSSSLLIEEPGRVLKARAASPFLMLNTWTSSVIDRCLDCLHAHYTVIRFVWVSAKFGTCTVVSANGTLVEAKMCTFTLEFTHFIFNKCPIYTSEDETDYSVDIFLTRQRINNQMSQALGFSGLVSRSHVNLMFTAIFSFY